MTEATIQFDSERHYMFGYNHNSHTAEPDEIFVARPTEIQDGQILFHFMRGLRGEAEWIKKAKIIGVGDAENGDVEIVGWSGKYQILNEELFEKYFTSGLIDLKIPEEHERRFLIDLKNVPGTLSDYSMIVILQGYLGKEKLMRVRQEWTGNEYEYTKTVKTGAGISRPELERRITKDKFDQLWQQVKYSLSKDRYHVLWEGIDIELNIYCDELDGYHQIEVEFDSNEAALAFVPPAWFGKEVTDDPRHGNFSLAKDGIPK